MNYFSLEASVIFNRPINKETDRISPGGYTMIFGDPCPDREFDFDFQVSFMNIDRDNPHILHYEQREPDYIAFPEVEDIARIKSVKSIKEWYVDTDTTDGSDSLIPIAILEASFFDVEGNETAISKELLLNVIPTSPDSDSILQTMKAPPAYGTWTDVRAELPDQGKAAFILWPSWNVDVSCLFRESWEGKQEIIPHGVLAWMPLPESVNTNAEKWNSASNPPSTSGRYLVEDDAGDMIAMDYRCGEGWELWDKYSNEIVAWRDLPPANFPF